MVSPDGEWGKKTIVLFAYKRFLAMQEETFI
jgi:hypothetical protein